MFPVSEETLALWGAGLSTVLAIIKIWEVWSSRRRIEVSYAFDDLDLGNVEFVHDIIIRNISPKPIIVTFWQLLFYEKRGFRWICFASESPRDIPCDIVIKGHESIRHKFSELNYPDRGGRSPGIKRLYIRLNLAGKRRAIKKLVYERMNM